jgi:hypothetical protein
MKMRKERASKIGVIETPNGPGLKGIACLPTMEEKYNADELHPR